MTIREYLERRAIVIRALSWIGFVSALATIYFIGVRPETLYRALFLLTTAILSTVMVLFARLRCPRCRQSLRKIARQIVFRKPPAANFCPNCGASFEGPMPP